MIPEEIRLFSWVDVEDVLINVRKTKGWPEWLKSVQAYWDGVTLNIDPGKRSEALQWLADVFAPRFREPSSDMEEVSIILEGLENFPRQLNIVILETEDTLSKQRFLPMLVRPGTLTSDTPKSEPENFPKDFSPLMALHSFKGGVGRTMAALSAAKAFTSGKENSVLLIDADMEAPGITWLLRKRLPNPAISFADVITLLHGASDSTDEIEKALGLIADRVQTSVLDNIYVLPAFRSNMQFTSLQIKPEHLVRYADNPYIITHALSQLGKMLGVNVVIADLRAGLSELSTGFLLDPRVHHIFVTTLSPQSVQGTEYVLRLIGERASPKTHHPLPKIIFSQIPDSYAKKKELMEPEIIKIENASQSFDLKRKKMLFTMHDQNLMVPKPSWDEMMNLLERSSLFPDVKKWIEPFLFSEGTSLEDSSELHRLREKLVKETNFMMDTESGKMTDFLQISPVRRLANDFRRSLPIVFIEGSEGSGKTCIFLQMIRKQEWKDFISDAGTEEPVQVNAGTYPVFYPGNLSNEASHIISETEEKIRYNLGLPKPLSHKDFTYEISENVRNKNLNEDQWRNLWLNLIAWRMGFDLGEKNAGQRFPQYLREREKNVIAVIDGLEDILHDIFITSGLIPVHFLADEKTEDEEAEKEQKKRKEILQSFYVSLRVLLRDIPLWLEQQPGRPLGILIFIRSHIIQDAFLQDADQLANRYMPYALKWHIKDALQLCRWIFGRVSSPQNFNSSGLSDFSENELRHGLVSLWGRSFMLEDLPDFSESVIAGDVIRFLHAAAKNSVGDTDWKDCLFTPDAISKSAKEYFMELTQKQQVKLRQISDTQLYDKAEKFIEKNGVITNAQIAGLENITNTAARLSDILKFVNHQADKDNKEIAEFYRRLKTELENIRNDVKNNRDFVPEGLIRKELSGHKEFFGLLFVREFIRHLSAEHRYRSGDE